MPKPQWNKVVKYRETTEQDSETNNDTTKKCSWSIVYVQYIEDSTRLILDVHPLSQARNSPRVKNMTDSVLAPTFLGLEEQDISGLI